MGWLNNNTSRLSIVSVAVELFSRLIKRPPIDIISGITSNAGNSGIRREDGVDILASGRGRG